MIFFSPSQLKFFGGDLKEAYLSAGSWPFDAIPVDNTQWFNYALSGFPSGMVLGTTQHGLPTWVPAPVVAPDPGKLAADALLAGCAIVSTGSPDINGTYGLDDTTMAQIGALARDVASGLGFPLGTATFHYPDASGAAHEMDEAGIVALYKALRDYIYQVRLFAAGQSLALPTLPVTIA